MRHALSASLSVKAGRTIVTGVIRHFIEKYIVTTVPNAMSACLDCKVVQCTADEWETCANRLSRKATLDHMPIDDKSGSDAEA